MAKEVEKKFKGRKISEVVKGDLNVDSMIKITQIEDTVVQIDEIVLRDGKHGEFVQCVIRTEPDGQRLGVSCGGVVVVKKCKALLEDNRFPYLGKFIDHGEYKDLID